MSIDSDVTIMDDSPYTPFVYCMLAGNVGVLGRLIPLMIENTSAFYLLHIKYDSYLIYHLYNNEADNYST